MKNLVLALVLLGFLVPTAHAETVLYCQAELATGFIKQNGRWVSGNFEENRYTIKFNDDYTELGYVLNGRDTEVIEAGTCEQF